jgi:hypothetical protein
MFHNVVVSLRVSLWFNIGSPHHHKTSSATFLVDDAGIYYLPLAGRRCWTRIKKRGNWSMRKRTAAAD